MLSPYVFINLLSRFIRKIDFLVTNLNQRYTRISICQYLKSIYLQISYLEVENLDQKLNFLERLAGFCGSIGFGEGSQVLLYTSSGYNQPSSPVAYSICVL